VKVAAQCVVSLDYSLHLGDGKVVDVTDGTPADTVARRARRSDG